ncbi:TonB family protein [Sphingomonas sp. H39-1-10]|uniref:TonB family protein n=1 Tax=Sphingomonas pollutisoli TaxID=3030829 RepID=UPI0023BA24D7|nr:TonB family protein [Sphingomonas pollutisoli]MDF0488132.1 TonB family protein [Sphingomonas pollutisoli]
MYADRHARHTQINPGSAALALAINGAILGGLVLFANPTFKKHVETILTINPIPLEPVKPPPPPQPQPKPKTIEQASPQPVDTSTPVTVTKIADPAPISQPTFTPALDGGGTAGAGTVEIAKPVPPVLVDPTIDPRYASLFQPLFPPDEQRAGRGGRVVVRVLVGVDGRVKDIEQVSATSDSFFAVTRRRALEKWRFKPGTRDGIPVEAWRTVAVSFVLNDAE